MLVSALQTTVTRMRATDEAYTPSTWKEGNDQNILEVYAVLHDSKLGSAE